MDTGLSFLHPFDRITESPVILPLFSGQGSPSLLPFDEGQADLFPPRASEWQRAATGAPLSEGGTHLLTLGLRILCVGHFHRDIPVEIYRRGTAELVQGLQCTRGSENCPHRGTEFPASPPPFSWELISVFGLGGGG